MHLLYSDLFHQFNQNSQALYVCVRECHNGNKISKYLTHQNKMSELSLRYVIKEFNVKITQENIMTGNAEC